MIRIFLAFLLLMPLMGLAQTWPARPVKLVTNFAPGSAPDVAARVIGRFLAQELRHPVVVDGRVGAAGNVGVENVVRSAPDGYTLLHSPGSTSPLGALVAVEAAPGSRMPLDPSDSVLRSREPLIRSRPGPTAGSPTCCTVNA